uniref:G-protein coupled receptors family 1 profile domain-containing protein n=1 Tax=Meloidogyne floridensis TaxID=298350 RepID=A0A915NQF9_9BILA
MSDTRSSPLVRTTWIINTGVDQVGTVLFAFLIIATIKQKRLHGTCHLLLGIYAVCSLLSKIQILLPFAIFMLPGSGKIPRLYCALIQIIPVGGCLNVFSLMLIIGIDRMLAIFLPIWYSTRSEKHYLKLMYIVSLSFPLIFLGFVINTTIQDPFLNVQCFFADLVGTDGQNIFQEAQVVLIAIVQRKAIYKTLSLIMGIQIVGYAFTSIAYNIKMRISYKFTDEDLQYITCAINCISSLSSSLEVPILFVVSTEHRLAIKSEFRWLFRNSSSPTNINNSKNVQNISQQINTNLTKSVQKYQPPKINTLVN